MLSKKVFQLASLTSSNICWYEGNARYFGLISEYNERANKKLNINHLMPEKQLFFSTPSRPGNFGENIDFKATIDNWFE